MQTAKRPMKQSVFGPPDEGKIRRRPQEGLNVSEPNRRRSLNDPVHLPVDRTKVSEGKARMDNQRAAGTRSMPEVKMVVRTGRKKRKYKFNWPDPEELTEN